MVIRGDAKVLFGSPEYHKYIGNAPTDGHFAKNDFKRPPRIHPPPRRDGAPPADGAAGYPPNLI